MAFKRLQMLDVPTLLAKLKEGFSQGHTQGLDEGKLIVELRPGTATSPGSPGVKEPALFKDWRFAITPEMAAEIRQDVKHWALSKPSHSYP